MFRRTRFDEEMREELQHHLAEREAAYIRDGLTPEEARRRARLDFGNPQVIHEQSRDVWIVRMLDELRRDVAIAARSIRSAPVFAAATIATFALGIGAATAIFSVAYGVAFRPLPYPGADRLVRIYESNTKTSEPKLQVSMGTFQAWRESVPSLESLALFSRGERVAYTAGDNPQPITNMSVSPGFFEVLGARPLIGRTFKPESEYTRRTTNEFVLSYGAWQRLFGGDPNIAGRLFYIREDDDPIRIVGVMPADFSFENQVDVWRPNIVELPVARILRAWRYDHVVARLKPGRTLEHLRAELDVVSARLAQEHPATNGGWTAAAEPLRDAIIGGFGRASWLFLAAVGAVLLAACANVAGLLTARSLARTRETGIRITLGAGWGRVARLWMAETFLLAGAGAVAGVTLAWWLVRLLRAAAPPGLPRVEHIAVDWPVLAGATVVTLMAALVCALAPLGTLRRERLAGSLAAGSTRTSDTPTRKRVSAALVAVQAGAALALIVLSLVFGRSFLNLISVDLGWQPARLLALDVSPTMPPNMRRPWFLYTQWADALVSRLEQTPGIARAAVTTSVPFSGRVYAAAIGRGAAVNRTEPRWPVTLHMVTPRYFEMMGLGLARGRLFTADDRFEERVRIGETPEPSGVAILSESAARALWPGEDPIGKVFHIPSQITAPQTVVGIVKDVRFASVIEPPGLEVFLPWAQQPTGNPRLIVQAVEDAAAIAPAVRGALLAENARTGIDRVTPVEALVDRATAPARVTRNLIAGLGLLALVLAGVGVFGGLSMLVAAGARETAVRMALGASPRMTMRAMLLRGLTPVAIGAAGGVMAAALLVHGARGLLYGIARVDAPSLAAGLAVVSLVTALACLIPALRASRTDPLSVLRGD